MSKKELNVEEIEIVESEEITEEPKTTRFTKVLSFVKENSKKIIVETVKGVAFVLVGAVVGVKLARVMEYEDAYEDEGFEVYDEESVASDDVTE